MLHAMVLRFFPDHEGPEFAFLLGKHIVRDGSRDRNRADLHAANRLHVPSRKMVHNQLRDDPPVARVREDLLAIDVVFAHTAGRQGEARGGLPMKGAGLDHGLGEFQFSHARRVSTTRTVMSQAKV